MSTQSEAKAINESIAVDILARAIRDAGDIIEPVVLAGVLINAAELVGAEPRIRAAMMARTYVKGALRHGADAAEIRATIDYLLRLEASS